MQVSPSGRLPLGGLVGVNETGKSLVRSVEVAFGEGEGDAGALVRVGTDGPTVEVVLGVVEGTPSGVDVADGVVRVGFSGATLHSTSPASSVTTNITLHLHAMDP